MGAALRSEWIKLRSVRSNTVMICIALGLPLLIALLNGLFEDFPTDQGTWDLVLGTGLTTTLLTGVIAVTSITGEYQYNTIRPTFTAIPRRRRVLVAKALVAIAVAAAARGVQVLLTWGVVRAIQAIRGLELTTIESYVTTSDDFGNDIPATLVQFQPGRAVIGSIIFAMIFAIGGLAVGLLIHHTAGAIATLLVWTLVAENLVFGILSLSGVDEPQRWLPFSAGTALLDTTNLGISRVWGGAYFAAFAVALAVLGALRTERSDA